MFARYDGTCAGCKGPIRKGVEIIYVASTGQAFHVTCRTVTPDDIERQQRAESDEELAARLGFTDPPKLEDFEPLD